MHAGARIAALDTPFNRETLAATGEYFSIDTLGMTLDQLRDESPGCAAAARAAASSRAAQRFNVDAVVGAYETLLCEVAASKARSSFAMRTLWNDSDHG